MAWLKRRGYRVLSLEEFLSYRQDHRLPPAHSVVITIDDGYADNQSRAYPILQRYGFPATIFLVSGSVGGVNQWDQSGELAGRPLLSLPEIRAMLRGGIQIGAHSRTHSMLTTEPIAWVQEEVLGSRLDLEHDLQVPIRVFAYPYGEYDSAIQTIAEQAGFLGSCGVKMGKNSLKTPSHALRRIEIRGTDSMLRFVCALWTGQRGELFQRRSR
jgi:peptidoglycan/xylan/chitin deacetylase (PgdA/CDA1 family)